MKRKNSNDCFQLVSNDKSVTILKFDTLKI